MTERIFKTVDKTGWGPGPWQLEPDRVEWTDHATGLECVVLRHFHIGCLNGYVGVPFVHPLWGRDRETLDVDVHGDLTFSGQSGFVSEGEGTLWWFGFDCGHAWDLSPGLEAQMREVGIEPFDARLEEMGIPAETVEMMKPRYKPIGYVRAETERLAAQLAGIKVRAS